MDSMYEEWFLSEALCPKTTKNMDVAVQKLVLSWDKVHFGRYPFSLFGYISKMFNPYEVDISQSSLQGKLRGS